MATIGNSTPLLYVEGSATQTGASGTQRTVKITAKFKVNGSGGYYYGYPCSWRARVHSSYGSYVSFKGNETWYGSDGLRTFEQTLTVDVGTTNSTNITVGIYTNNSTYSYWNGSYTWTFGVGSTNVAPTLSGTIDTNPSGTINESISKIDLTSPTASDGNNNLSGYRFAVSVNGGGYSEIYKGSSRTYTHNISGGEGTTYKYSCYAYDASNATSSTIYSNTVTKNTLTGGSFTGHSNDISYDTTSFTLNFGGGSNTNGAGVKYLCYSDTAIVYNQQETTSGSQTITIWRSGAYPSGPYIKFDDLKSFFASSNYNGRLHVGLRTGNEYGTYKWSGGSIGVDLRVNPPAPSNAIIASSSTIWKTTTSGSKYLIPDGSGRISVDCGVVSGSLGESIIYEFYVAYGSGGWSYLGNQTGINGSTVYYHHYIAKQTTSQSVKYLVRAKTSYGYYTDSVTASETLHYYNAPTLIQGAITRGATTADVKITIKSNSSIPNIGTTGSWLTSPTTVSGNLTSSQSEQNIAITGLTDSGTYTLKVTYNDNTGFSSDQTASIAIGQNSPLFFVNKFGAGVGGAKADSSSALIVNGVTKSTNGVHIDSGDTTADTSKSHSTFVVRSGNNLANRPIDYCTIFNIGANNNSNGQFAWNYNSNELDLRFRKRHDVSGTYGAWRQIYHTGFKPSAADVGAIGSSSDGNYWGMTTPAGSSGSWIRTTSSGLIPNTSNGSSGYGSGSLGTATWRFQNIYGNYGDFNGHINSAGTTLSRDTLTFADNSVWKSIDFTRTSGSTTGTVRFGIGANVDGPSPTIEFKPGTSGISGANALRIDVGLTSLRTQSDGSDQSCWLGLYSGGSAVANRQGYFGRGSNSNNHIYAYAEKGALIIRSKYGSTGVCADDGGYWRPEANNGYACGHGSYRWSTVYYTNLNAASDEKLKDNIKYVSEENAIPYSADTAQITTKDCYNFVKNDLKLATYDYKVNPLITENGLEQSRMTDKLGFIAQDLVGTKIGSFLINEDEVEINNTFDEYDVPGEKAGEYIQNKAALIPSLLNEGETTLSYDLTDYVNVLAGALQTAINEVESLKNKLMLLEQTK